jgi:hypothetical protein
VFVICQRYSDFICVHIFFGFQFKVLRRKTQKEFSMKKYFVLSLLAISFTGFIAKAADCDKSLMLAFYSNMSNTDLPISDETSLGNYTIGDDSISCTVNFASAGSCDASSYDKLASCDASAVTCSPSDSVVLLHKK